MKGTVYVLALSLLLCVFSAHGSLFRRRYAPGTSPALLETAEKAMGAPAFPAEYTVLVQDPLKPSPSDALTSYAFVDVNTVKQNEFQKVDTNRIRNKLRLNTEHMFLFFGDATSTVTGVQSLLRKLHDFSYASPTNLRISHYFAIKGPAVSQYATTPATPAGGEALVTPNTSPQSVQTQAETTSIQSALSARILEIFQKLQQGNDLPNIHIAAHGLGCQRAQALLAALARGSGQPGMTGANGEAVLRQVQLYLLNPTAKCGENTEQTIGKTKFTRIVYAYHPTAEESKPLLQTMKNVEPIATGIATPNKLMCGIRDLGCADEACLNGRILCSAPGASLDASYECNSAEATSGKKPEFGWLLSRGGCPPEVVQTVNFVPCSCGRPTAGAGTAGNGVSAPRVVTAPVLNSRAPKTVEEDLRSYPTKKLPVYPKLNASATPVMEDMTCFPEETSTVTTERCIKSEVAKDFLSLKRAYLKANPFERVFIVKGAWVSLRDIQSCPLIPQVPRKERCRKLGLSVSSKTADELLHSGAVIRLPVKYYPYLRTQAKRFNFAEFAAEEDPSIRNELWMWSPTAAPHVANYPLPQDLRPKTKQDTRISRTNAPSSLKEQERRRQAAYGPAAQVGPQTPAPIGVPPATNAPSGGP